MSSYIILIIMGVIMSVIIASTKNKYKKLSKNKEKADGVLMGYESSTVKTNNLKIPVVRFETRAKQQIVQKTEANFYSDNAKKGSKVLVFYDPANPEEFMIQSKHFQLTYSIIMIVGILFSLTGLILLLNYTGVIKLFK